MLGKQRFHNKDFFRTVDKKCVSWKPEWKNTNRLFIVAFFLFGCKSQYVTRGNDQVTKSKQ